MLRGVRNMLGGGDESSRGAAPPLNAGGVAAGPPPPLEYATEWMKPLTIYVRQDFLKRVRIVIFIKKANLYTLDDMVCVLKKLCV